MQTGYQNSVAIFIYQRLYSLLLPILWLVQFFHPKLRLGYKLRKRQNGTYPWLNFKKHTNPIWFHCASGEYEYAKPVIRELKKTHPNQTVIVTYFSPSIEKSLAQATDVDFFCPTPWDKVSLWQEFIEHHQPCALVIARTDLWPSMLKAAKKSDIPRLLFAKTVNEKKSWFSSLIEKPLLKSLTDIFCVSEVDRDLLYRRLKPYRQIHNAGDPRYDQCLYRLAHPKPLKPLNNFNKPMFLAASTWPKDEEVVLPLIQERIKTVAFIIAPHEPTEKHLLSLEAQLKALSLKTQRYSQTNNWDPEAVLLIDQVGILADLYAWARFSFVGGSMSRSVHSVLESLASGSLTFIGPKHFNNREALLFKNKNVKGISPVQVVQGSRDFSEKFANLHSRWPTEYQDELRYMVKRKSGTASIVVRWIGNNLKTWT